MHGPSGRANMASRDNICKSWYPAPIYDITFFSDLADLWETGTWNSDTFMRDKLISYLILESCIKLFFPLHKDNSLGTADLTVQKYEALQAERYAY